MNIEPGKHYITRDGRAVGPIKLSTSGSLIYPYRAVGPGEGDRMLLWGKDGNYCVGHRDHPYDLVSEHAPLVELEIKVGKHYATRDGQIVGPIILNRGNSAYLYKAFDARGILLWGEDGSYWVGRRDHPLDLVSEHIPPVVLDITVGKYYVTRGGQIVGPMRLNKHVYFSQTYPYRAVGPNYKNNLISWLENGSYALTGIHAYDLVAEHIPPKPHFIITEPGEYITRGGRTVRVLCIDAPGKFPVIGYVHAVDTAATEQKYPYLISWRENGSYALTDIHDYDLVAAKPVTHVLWFNVYKTRVTGPYLAKEHADTSAAGNRLECQRKEFTVPHAAEKGADQ